MVGILGGIGSGKSVVSRILRLRGFGVFDCDYEAKALMNSDSEMKGEINRILGENLYGDGMLDRATVSEIIFRDSGKRHALNALVHSAVKRRLVWWSQQSDTNRFVECAIAGSSGVLDFVDEILLVDAPKEVRERRVCCRDGHSLAKVRDIMNVQDREEELIKKSGKKIFVLVNSGEESLLGQMESLGFLKSENNQFNY